MVEHRVRLVSDFLDYYDHWFDVCNVETIFERFSSGEMPRRKMLEYLQSLGLKVPSFGRPAEVYERGHLHPEAIVHLNENAHCGEGKIKIALSDAIIQYPDSLTVEYIPALSCGQGQSWRHLQIGDKKFWLKYTSKDDWRSNCGDVTIDFISQEEDGYNPQIPLPLFAIDFVLGNKFYAIDFNSAPRVKGTGIEAVLSASAAAETIKRAIDFFNTLDKKSPPLN